MTAAEMLRIDLDTSEEALLRDLGRGGAFIPGASAPLYSECPLELHAGEQTLCLLARVVWRDGNGIGIEILEFGAATREAVAALVPARREVVEASRPAIGLPKDDVDAAPLDEQPEESSGPRSATMHERLRNLPIHEQVKLALTGDAQERILLERMYGKTVWEPLLRNPRLTPPEVARIARMGQLPRPMIEIICNNGGWIAVPEVRRALLANPRLGPEQVGRILRVMPKHELKLMPNQMSYPPAVREAARRLLEQH